MPKQKRKPLDDLEGEYSEVVAKRRAQQAAQPPPARPAPAPVPPAAPPDLSAQVKQLAAAWGLKRKRQRNGKQQ
jgi:hypothetical protein